MSKVKLITEFLVTDITRAIKESATIYIMTSFVMNSGVKLLEKSLKEALDRGAEVNVLAGDYLYVTQPEALKQLIAIDERINVRLWMSNGTSFHPKAYLFQGDEGEGTLIVGSSNLSASALTKGVEWNIAMDAEVAPEMFEEAITEFLKLYHHEQTMSVNIESISVYETAYEKAHQNIPELYHNWTTAEEKEIMFAEVEKEDSHIIFDASETYDVITPRKAQAEALESLETTIEEEYEKAMVVMATGLGKTYLAAFFARQFKRVLFIAHREEILYQTQASFQKILVDRSFGIYSGKEKIADADCIFASIFTLANKKHLEKFEPETFDLIVIDEFHHAAASTYQKAIQYFKPKFLLGITATPDRMDGKDIFAICDGNVAYQLHFLEAIQRGWLAPFHYYGVYDDTNYQELTWLGTRYAEEELLQVQLKQEMAEKIYVAWKEHKQTRTIGFCSSIKQAIFLENYFKSKGVRAVSLHSKAVNLNRRDAIKQLDQGELEIIFTVDLFNEGVDIPSVDTLLFVRPTESLTVFTQQVGRGLRLFDGKDNCVIIDLIGNYRNADVKLRLFDTRSEKEKKQTATPFMPEVPGVCALDFDIQVVDLLAEMYRKRQPRKENLRLAYEELKMELGRRPTYLEMHRFGNANAAEFKQDFKSYVGFLYWADELNQQEQEVFKRYENWLIEVERTTMTKSYKMVVLDFMLSRGVEGWNKAITPEEAAYHFHDYLTSKEYRRKIDFVSGNTQKLIDYDEKAVAKLIATMPMTKWSGSSKELVTFKDNSFKLEFDVVEGDKEILWEMTRQVCEYRLGVYFERRGRNLR